MARNILYSTAFPSGIDAGWNNPPPGSVFNAWSFAGAGDVRVISTGQDTAMIRNTGTYPPAQWCKVTVLNLVDNSAFQEIAASVLGDSTTGATYVAIVPATSGAQPAWNIYRVDGAGSFFAIASSVTPSPSSLTPGDYIVLETDGLGNLSLYTFEAARGGGETLRLTGFDTTLVAGRPGVVASANFGTPNVSISAVEMGDFAAPAGSSQVLRVDPSNLLSVNGYLLGVN